MAKELFGVAVQADGTSRLLMRTTGSFNPPDSATSYRSTTF